MHCNSYAMHESIGVRASEQGRPGNLIDRLDSPTKNLVEKMFIFTLCFAFHDTFLNCAAVTACLFSAGVLIAVLNTLQHPNFFRCPFTIFPLRSSLTARASCQTALSRYQGHRYTFSIKSFPAFQPNFPTLWYTVTPSIELEPLQPCIRIRIVRKNQLLRGTSRRLKPNNQLITPTQRPTNTERRRRKKKKKKVDRDKGRTDRTRGRNGGRSSVAQGKAPRGSDHPPLRRVWREWRVALYGVRGCYQVCECLGGSFGE